MAKCYIHSKAVVANDGICGQCKSCSHKSWFRREDETIYQCNNCHKKSKNPTGEKWILTKDNQWKEEV